MPIHRVPGGKRGAVFAFAEEIDSWLVSQRNGTADENHRGNGAGESVSCESGNSDDALGAPGESYKPTATPTGGEAISIGGGNGAPSAATAGRGGSLKQLWKWLLASRARRFALVAGAVFIVGVPMARILRPAKGEASHLFTIKFQTNAIEAQDSRGRSMWTFPYAQPLRAHRFGSLPQSYEPVVVADFFNDGRREAAVPIFLRSGPNVTDEDYDQLDFFSGGGERLWSYVPDRSFRFGNYTLGGRWILFDIFASTQESETKLWAVACHHTFGDAFVVQLDPGTGKDTLRFVNTGTVYSLNEIKTPAGKFLLVGGFNNEWDGGSLAIINEDRAFAASPQTPGSRHHCDSCPPGDPDYYFVFPRSEINQASGIYENPVSDVNVSDDGIEVVKLERFNQGRETVISRLDPRPPFKLLSPLFNSEYNKLHEAWSAEGKLTHSLANCPERMHPQPVRLWTPDAGWTELPAKPAEAKQ